MNWKRIALGTLAAGLLIDVFEGGFSNLIVGAQFQREYASLGVHNQFTPLSAAFFIGWGFIVGFAAVFLYAAARPRLGGGPRTALPVALALWAVHGLVPHLRDAFLGIFSFSLSLEFAGLQLVWLVAGTLLILPVRVRR